MRVGRLLTLLQFTKYCREEHLPQKSAHHTPATWTFYTLGLHPQSALDWKAQRHGKPDLQTLSIGTDGEGFEETSGTH